MDYFGTDNPGMFDTDEEIEEEAPKSLFDQETVPDEIAEIPMNESMYTTAPYRTYGAQANRELGGVDQN